jgi:hypothetical protein
MNWKVPLMWEEADVWIIGGGPSVPKQFGIPDSVVQDVVRGSSPPSVYSSYMSYLHDKHVIGVNVAFLIGTWIDMVFFGDSNFFSKNQIQLAQFPGLRVSSHSVTKAPYWVKYLRLDVNHYYGISSDPTKVSWNGNSGAAAISIAANAGAKRIFLLGFDMKLGESQDQHWHDLYGRGKIEGKRVNKLPFGKHLIGFPQIAKDAKKRGIEIINVNPDSAIKDFRKVSMTEICGGLV